MNKNVIAFIVISSNNPAAFQQLPVISFDSNFKIDFINSKCVLISGSGFALNPGYGIIVSDKYGEAIIISETHPFEFPYNPEIHGLHFQAVTAAD